MALDDFSIRVATRHPAARDGYETGRHRYRPDYVRPSGWTLELTAAFPGLAAPPSRPLRLDDDDGNPDNDPPDFPGPPSGAGVYTWTVTELGGPFTTTVTPGPDRP